MAEGARERTIAYRADIDGLRALAVLAVVIFHLGFSEFSGGFVGVDVFFVISGFLITSILERRIEEEKFLFKDFYLGRVRRLLPALFVTVAATFVGAVWIMTPDELMLFARSAIGTVLSVSNFVFFSESGYWDMAAEFKPLLHTWSLGVEEQFYLVWPAIIFLTTRFLRHLRWLVFAASILIGLAVSEIMLQVNPSAAFYLLPFRIFEFCIGAITIYLARSSVWSSLSKITVLPDIVMLAGLTLFFASVWSFNEETPFPGLYAVLPCVGGMLIILAGTGEHGPGPISRLILANPILVWIGKISYSLYLVHWPIVSLYRYRTNVYLNLTEQSILICVILVATVLLYYGIERRFRFHERDMARRKPLTPLAFAFTTLACGFAVTLANTHVLLNKGWMWRMPNVHLTREDIEAGKLRRFDITRSACRIDHWKMPGTCAPDRAIQVLVFGNSHETDGFNFLTSGFGDRKDINLIEFGTLNECGKPHVRGAVWISDKSECNIRMATLFDPTFVSQLDVLVYSSNKPYAENKEDTVRMLETLKAMNPRLKIVVLGGYINTDIPCARLINKFGTTDACREPEHVVVFDEQPQTMPFYNRLALLTDGFIDRVSLLCAERQLNNCMTATPDGIPLMYDEHHLSLEFSEMSGKMFAEANPHFFDDLLFMATTDQTPAMQ